MTTSKYKTLWNFIYNSNKDKIILSFDEIKEILGFEIDHSFLNYKQELLSYGYSVYKISLKNKSVIIKKQI